VEALFGHLHPDDALGQNRSLGLAERLAGMISSDHPLIYAPLGVGRHVDHQIVHSASRWLQEQGRRLAYYEDYPYAERPGALESALALARAQTWRMETIALNAEDLAAKIAALGFYKTQLSILFGGAEAMPGRIRDFAASRSPQQGFAERIWWPVEA
jgi:hypothetical protein